MTRAFSELLRAAALLKLNEPVSTLRPSVMMTLSCMILNWLTVRTGMPAFTSRFIAATPALPFVLFAFQSRTAFTSTPRCFA